MKFFDSIQMWTTTNLVRRYQANWDPDLGHLNLLQPISDIPFKRQAPKAIEPTGNWAYPEVTLHDTDEGLLSQILPYRVAHLSLDTNAPILPAGPQQTDLAGSYDNVIKTRRAKAQLQQSKSLTTNLSPWRSEVTELFQVRTGS